MPLVVVTQPTSRDLIAAQDLRRELGAAADPKTDALLAMAAHAASALVSELCGRESFGRATYRQTERYAHSTHRDLRPFVLEMELNATVTEVRANDVVLGEDLWQQDGGLVYRLDEAGHQIRWPERSIEVTYTAGYELPDGCPAMLKRAATEIGAMLHLQRGRDHTIRQESLDGYASVSYGPNHTIANLTASKMPLLAPFRRVPV